MRIGANESCDPPALLGHFVQTAIRVVSIGVIALIAATAFFIPERPASDPSTPTTGLKIDINRADARELTLMPGIGRVTAERIMTDRQQHGPFKSLDDLKRVPGIGPKTVRSIAPYCRPIRRPDRTDVPSHALP